MHVEMRTFWISSKGCPSTPLDLPFQECLKTNTTSLGALTLRLVERAHSYLEDKNVSTDISSDTKQSDDNLTEERIAIARALLRNPKVLLLDEVSF